MHLSGRESFLAVTVAVIALFGISVVAARGKAEEWKEMRKKRTEFAGRIEHSRRILAEREKVERDFAEFARTLPSQPKGGKMDVHWLSLVDRTAIRRGLRVIKQKRGEEEKLGYMYEMPIECMEWEGDHNSVVGFLVDLENEKGMLDVRQLKIRRDERWRLRGSFMLYCAYTKEEEAGP